MACQLSSRTGIAWYRQAGKSGLPQDHPMNFGASGVDGSAAANAALKKLVGTIAPRCEGEQHTCFFKGASVSEHLLVESLSLLPPVELLF